MSAGLSPGQRDIIKTVALVLMVPDHINLMAQPAYGVDVLAGRGAFPAGFRPGMGLNLSCHARISGKPPLTDCGMGDLAALVRILSGQALV